jgi:hypothetical protein
MYREVTIQIAGSHNTVPSEAPLIERLVTLLKTIVEKNELFASIRFDTHLFNSIEALLHDDIIDLIGIPQKLIRPNLLHIEAMLEHIV